MDYCCKELEMFKESLDGVYIPIGDGDIQGSVELEKDDSNLLRLRIDNGWNVIPNIVFKYCPYCGGKQYVYDEVEKRAIERINSGKVQMLSGEALKEEALKILDEIDDRE